MLHIFLQNLNTIMLVSTERVYIEDSKIGKNSYFLPLNSFIFCTLFFPCRVIFLFSVSGIVFRTYLCTENAFLSNF